MTMHLQMATTLHGSWSNLDLADLGVSKCKLSISDSHASRLTFEVDAKQYERPIPYHAMLRLWDDAGSVRGATQSATNPLFEGFVEEIQPIASNRLGIVAFDPTYRAARDAIVFNARWGDGDRSEGIPPQPSSAAVPRLVYNCKNDADEDYSHQVGQDGTVGQILTGLLDWTYPALYWINAAPGDGTDAGNDVPYVSSDLSALDFKPQSKLVFQSESIRSAVERVQAYEPRARLLWEPGTRRWRFYRVDQGEQLTLALNDSTESCPVLTLDLQTSIEQCATAIKIYGPESTATTVFQWWQDPPEGESNTLVPVGDPLFVEEYVTAEGTQFSYSWAKWQIVNTALRRGARTLPDWYVAPIDQWAGIPIKEPQLHLSWDGGTTWIAAQGVWMDTLNGQAVFNAGIVPFYRYVDENGFGVIPGSTQTIFIPTSLKLIWAAYQTPLSVRVPTTGWEGTAHTVAGLEREYAIYDEALAVGYEYGQPVTTETRLAQYVKLAQALLDQRKNIAWTGGCVLDGCDYRFANLNKRVSFTSVGPTGTEDDVGWEAIDAVVTDVEYDFEEQITSITFSADQLQLLGEDAAALKERLKIRAAERRQSTHIEYSYRWFRNYAGYQVREWSGVKAVTTTYYVDPETGAPA